jgi:hypothetical protein
MKLKTRLCLEWGGGEVDADDGRGITDMKSFRVLSSSEDFIHSKILFVATAFLSGGEGDKDGRMSVARPPEMPSLRL